MFDPVEILRRYAQAGRAKTTRSLTRVIILAVLGGLFITFGAAASSTAAFGLENAGLGRLVSGLVFPFGLGIVMLCGAELFTGNCLIVMPVLEGEVPLGRMLRNWAWVYLGNFAGALLLAAGCVFAGQLNWGGGALAVYTVKVAAAKCALPFAGALVEGVFCNVLVCAGVLCALSAEETIGKIAGAYIPVAFFVICGFEHCVANMYYVPAGLFAMAVPEYAALVAQAGLDVSGLSWGAFLLNNLLPVTLGNIIGGAGLGALMWRAHRPKGAKVGEG